MIMAETMIQMLVLLRDGGWHDVSQFNPHTGPALVRRGLIYFTATGAKSHAIIADAGMICLDELFGDS